MTGFPKTLTDFPKNQSLFPKVWQDCFDRQAESYLSNQQFFSGKTESWKYFPFQKVMKQNFVFGGADSSLPTDTLSPCMPSSLLISMQNGKTLPLFQETKNLLICSWKEFLLSKHDLDSDIKKQILKTLKKQRNPLCSLNNALCSDGVILIIKGKLNKPLEIHYTQSDKNKQQGLNLRNFIFLEKDSSAQILEIFHGRKEKKPLFLNIQTDCFLEKSAQLEYSRVDQAEDKDSIIHHLFADLNPKASACFFSLSLNAGISRYSCNIEQEEKSQAEIRGLSLLDGSKYTDHQADVKHKGKKGASHQIYKSFLFDSASQVFQGKTSIDRLAQKSNTSQLSKNFLFNKGTFAVALPELDVTADDVTAIHGATVSPWEENKRLMFYLKSRGLDSFQAFHLLFSGIVKQTLSCFKPNTQEVFYSLLEKKMHSLKHSVRSIFHK